LAVFTYTAACLPALTTSLAMDAAPVALGFCVLAACGALALASRSTAWRSGFYKPFRAPAVLVLSALVALGLAATPFAPGGAHPFWQPIGPGAAVLDLEACFLGGSVLVGLSLAVLIAAKAGADRTTAPRTIAALPFIMLLPAIALGLRYGVYAEAATGSLLAVFLGSSLVLCAGSSLRSWRDVGAPGVPRRMQDVGAAPWITLACALGLGIVQPKALVAAIAALFVLMGWELLAAGGAGRLRRGPLLGVLGLGVLVVVSAVGVGLARMDASSAGEACWRAHLGAAMAAPWLGYGPGSMAAIASLSMTRENVAALSDPPCPPSAYLAAFEQGGALVAVPLVLALVSLIWSAVSGSVRRRGMAGPVRALVCSVGFCALFAAVDAAPGTLAGLTPALMMLALAVGVSRAGR
jgi:hypothetical protein